jgi:subfamily B ATP-binding cassette protein MsbA
MEAGVVLGLLYMASTRVNVIPVAYQKFMAASGAILTYEQLIAELDANHEGTMQVASQNADFEGDLIFNNVSFKYTKSETYALKNLSITIPNCSSVAFVGGSGAGKSTIINLITGLLKPDSGNITLSNTDFKKLNLASLRSGIGYVTQDPVIFNDTVKNNISFWDEKESDSKTKKAACAAHADSFISKMPKKYNTMLGDNGANISGGQKQRISIAREFYRETPLLILDEATSALDSETEQIIQQSINEMHGQKTMIIIAHRLSTIKHCDKIFVLDNGQLVEQGNYKELLAENGLFKEMVERQSL